MRILFQGGWKAGRNPDTARDMVAEYCRVLAGYVVKHDHQLVLTSWESPHDLIIAKEIVDICDASRKDTKRHLMYLLPQRYTSLPTEGVVRQLDPSRWWLDERTTYVHECDAVIAVGGRRGTFDCIQKAFLAKKPVFVAGAVPAVSTEAWKRRPTDYYYTQPGDAAFAEDLNTTPDEFFTSVFSLLASLSKSRYPRRIFVVHGRDDRPRDQLVALLQRLDFEPVVLQKEPSNSLTIIEKLERDLNGVGFGFAIYTPDDEGRLRYDGEICKPRARQNVLFEHGLLVGLLGRARTCALVHGDVELFSDYHGVIVERFDNIGDEPTKVARVLKQAGYELDAAKLL